MGKLLIKCPRDPRNHYLREVCEEIFRKNDLRYWCKACEAFQEKKKTSDK